MHHSVPSFFFLLQTILHSAVDSAERRKAADIRDYVAMNTVTLHITGEKYK